MVALLLEHGASINMTASSGATPLQRAQDNGHQRVVELLRKQGAER
jgi:ankyrin repeat protein